MVDEPIYLQPYAEHVLEHERLVAADQQHERILAHVVHAQRCERAEVVSKIIKLPGEVCVVEHAHQLSERLQFLHDRLGLVSTAHANTPACNVARRPLVLSALLLRQRPAFIHVLTQNEVVEHQTPTTEVVDMNRTSRLLLSRCAFLEHIRAHSRCAERQNNKVSHMHRERILRTPHYRGLLHSVEHLMSHLSS